MSIEEILANLSPEVRNQVDFLLRTGRNGPGTLFITDVASGCPSVTPPPCCDRFKLHIPYAGETLTWDVIFNALHPELSPDFIFGEDTDFMPNPERLPHLTDWDPHEADCLQKLLAELLEQYREHQIEHLHKCSRLLFEYNSLAEETNYGRNLEVFAGHHPPWGNQCCVRFLLHLPIDTRDLPAYLLKGFLNPTDPGEDVVLLLVTFEDIEATKVTPKLYLSQRIECALGEVSSAHAPPFPGGGCLLDYVPQVCEFLSSKIQYVVQSYHKRREYIAAFLSHFGRAIVEYDAEGFTKLSLLLENDCLYCLIHIDLPICFPRDQPVITFQSCCHFTAARFLLQQLHKSYPYSPRWDGNEMAVRARSFFKEAIPSFLEMATVNGTY
uniref:BRISC and BRCA1-A complex member 2-like n=1 Tax=Myxine glutinosa TaxID=7769 RepID=UPI00358F85DE